ncbi:MAG TPA: SDR family oxidoreductase [Bryobacterales bacterium]|nr:SDR family oxidoreductase [Bryobacterales bacterium]
METQPQPWALILGASSGFGEATGIELARAGMNIFGVHFDRRATLPHVEEVMARIRALGREPVFFNANAVDEEKRKEILAAMQERCNDPARPGTVRVVLHSIAFGALVPYVSKNQDKTATKAQLEMTSDTMAHSLVYWVQDLVQSGLMKSGGRVYAMTSAGGARAIPQYGPVSGAKALLEAHIRQLALELAPFGITANAIRAGVTDTPSSRKIPGSDKLFEFAAMRNPYGRLTTPEDVARCIAVLSSENTYWMTGNTIGVDGGEDIVA